MASSMAPEEYEEAIFDAALSTAGMRLLEIVETGDVEAVRKLVKTEHPPMFFQDPGSGWSALHVAANIESAELLSYLIEEGAVWNAVDNLGNTTGDVALSLNNQECYDTVRDAGLRSEFILRALGDHVGDAVLKTDDETAAASTDAFLASSLHYTTDENGQEVCMVDAGGEEVGVMMGWEQPIMDETVKQLSSTQAAGSEGLAILNIGFGLGMIDTLFQNLPVRPQLHVIVEAHPDVLEHMQKQGWYDKPGVVVLEGKWQDVLESGDLFEYGGFDVIYTDTFSEEYSELYNFFEQLPDLLKGPGSMFSWFNGLGATNALFYDVYSRLADMHLKDFGLTTTWSDLEVPGQDESIWSGSRKYFSLPIYRLPICRLEA